MTTRTVLAIVLVLAPFTAALAGLLIALASGVRRRLAAGLGIVGASVALACAIWLSVVAGSGETDTARSWVRFGSLDVTLGLRFDRGLAYVLIAVAAVALAVQVYSVAYLHNDDRYPPYAAQISLFTTAMLLVVVSGDLVVLLAGWEVMGACSYLLIGHDRSLPEAPAAAVKAFLVTRVGDVGFLLGIALLGIRAGSFRIEHVLAAASTGRLSPSLLTVAGLLLLFGAVGKSAQFPLHTWLPDAMAGPTPISALIHAATMVAAGVIVLVKLAPLFVAAPGLLAVIGIVAAITMLLGALAATAQDDIKRVLAWSTVSQVAYMFAGFSVGLRGPALFHLLTHAAFKALLFLAAGCVIHAVGSNLMSRMGGLRRAMPVTFAAMTVGLAALAGVPPFSGFFSKDSVVEAAWTAAGGDAVAPRWIGVTVLVVALVTVALTGWYATRLWLLTFFGTYRGGAAPHEAAPMMRWPVIVLTIPAALLGFAGFSTAFARALDGPGSTGGAFTPWHVSTLVSLAMVATGAFAAWSLWRREPGADPARVLGAAQPALANGFYLDDLQHALVVRPVTALASMVLRGDSTLVDGTVEGTAASTVRLGGWAAVWHGGALPRAAAAVLAGALAIGVAAVIVGGL